MASERELKLRRLRDRVLEACQMAAELGPGVDFLRQVLRACELQALILLGAEREKTR